MKVLQGGVGDFPPSLRPLHERSVDLTFIGCAAPAAMSSCCPEILEMHRSHDLLLLSLRETACHGCMPPSVLCSTQHGACITASQAPAARGLAAGGRGGGQ